MDFVDAYCKKIGYTKGDAEFYLRHNNEFITVCDGEDKISGAAILLFGNNPQKFLPRARVRFVRYEGTTAQVGDKMNVIKDVKFTGRILDQVNNAVTFVKTQIRDYTKLGQDVLFHTIPEYPDFCWTELIVNAVAHRDYSIMGTDIQIKMFDDHFTVESPGTLPGLVRVNNIREYHFSRNPKIVELLNEYDLVKEFGEGIDRIYRDMSSAELPEPNFRESEFMFYATLRNKNWGKENVSWEEPEQVSIHDGIHDGIHDESKILQFCEKPKSRQEIMEFLQLVNRKNFVDRYLSPLLSEGKLIMTLPDKPKSKNQKYVASK